MDIDELVKRIRIEGDESSVTAEAGIVHKERQRIVLGQARLELGERAPVGEIRADHLGPCAGVAPQPLRQHFEAVAPTSDQKKVMTGRREPLGEYHSDPGRGARDTGPRSAASVGRRHMTSYFLWSGQRLSIHKRIMPSGRNSHNRPD